MIQNLTAEYTNKINKAIDVLKAKYSIEENVNIVFEIPPKKELGDVAFPMFSLSKLFKKSPVQIATEVKEILNDGMVAGGYLNFFFDKKEVYKNLTKDILKNDWGKNSSLKNEKIMIEFSSPNTNKPLHLGHMRNNILGECITSIFKESGAEVLKVDLINDRGIHICKSMLAYKKFGDAKTPESTGIKGDHFVGDYYVKFNSWSKEFENSNNKDENTSPEKQAALMLEKWEEGDKETIQLWEKMREWTLSGIFETYKNTGISFDKLYYESQMYKKGKAEVQKGLDKGVFYKSEDGAVKVDLSPINLDEKVLLRSDGTSIYITQDLGIAISRHTDWPYTSCMYVVGNEQIYHFKVLFYILKLLGYSWSEKLYHLSYGMVNLPNGKMKSREGTVVDADDLLNDVITLAKKKVEENYTDKSISRDKVDVMAKSVALGAINYYLLSASPTRDMIFNTEESLSFNGNTGPYIQYMGARVSSIIRNSSFTEDEIIEKSQNVDCDISLLEWQLISLIDSYPETIKKCAEDKDPSILTSLVYEASSLFSKWYHDTPILKAEDNVKLFRLSVCVCFKRMLQKAFNILHIPFLSEM